MNTSSVVIEIIGTVLFFFYERYFKCKKHKQKHLSNIQPNISTNEKTIVTFNQIFLQVKKHLSYIHADNIHKKTQVDMCLSI